MRDCGWGRRVEKKAGEKRATSLWGLEWKHAGSSLSLSLCPAVETPHPAVERQELTRVGTETEIDAAVVMGERQGQLSVYISYLAGCWRGGIRRDWLVACTRRESTVCTLQPSRDQTRSEYAVALVSWQASQGPTALAGAVKRSDKQCDSCQKGRREDSRQGERSADRSLLCSLRPGSVGSARKMPSAGANEHLNTKEGRRKKRCGSRLGSATRVLRRR